MGVVLGELLLRASHDVLFAVEENGPGAGGALVKRQEIAARHDWNLLVSHIPRGDKISPRAADVFQDHLSRLDRCGEGHAVERLNGGKDQ